MRSHPEARLYYPGASVVQPFGGPEIHYADGEKNSAFSGAILSSADSSTAIYQWYQRWLLDHGWHSFGMARLSTEVSVEGYARGNRERFDVAIEDGAALARTLGQAIPAGQTVFEARYIIFPG